MEANMWLITNIGFFSVVQKHVEDDVLTIRARVREDLDRLRETYLPSLTPTVTGAGADYKYRATVQHVEFGQAVAKMIDDIDYSNFKNEVTRTQGHRRAKVYHGVWDVLYELQA